MVFFFFFSFNWLNLLCCIVFQILMSAKIQTPVIKNAITFLGVSIAIVRRAMKAMGSETELVAVLKGENPT